MELPVSFLPFPLCLLNDPSFKMSLHSRYKIQLPSSVECFTSGQVTLEMRASSHRIFCPPLSLCLSLCLCLSVSLLFSTDFWKISCAILDDGAAVLACVWTRFYQEASIEYSIRIGGDGGRYCPRRSGISVNSRCNPTEFKSYPRLNRIHARWNHLQTDSAPFRFISFHPRLAYSYMSAQVGWKEALTAIRTQILKYRDWVNVL